MKVDKFEQMNMFSIMYDQYKITKPIRLIELFAGIGSQHEALKRLGADVEPYKVVEFDKYAISSYNAIHDTNFKTSDITKIHAKDLEIIDTKLYDYILTYSFPCTDLSVAGKQQGMKKGSGTRSGLLWEVERILEECSELPQVLLMENVPQVHSEENMPDFIAWQNKLESLGYTNYWQDLNAKDYGIPHNRNRCFMISILGKHYYKFPRPFKLVLKLKDMLESEVDEKYYLSDKLMQNFMSNKTPKLIIPENTIKGYAEAGDGDGVYINRPHQKRGVVQKDKIPTIKANCGDVGVVVVGNYSPSNHNASRIVDSEGLAPTVMENHGTVTAVVEVPQVINNLRIRKLTPKECWRLMGFADESFDKAEKVNSNAQLYKQAGNSIVVNVLMNIFKQLL